MNGYWILIAIYGISVLFSAVAFAIDYDAYDDSQNNNKLSFLHIEIKRKYAKIIIFTPIINTIFATTAWLILMFLFSFIGPAILFGLCGLYSMLFCNNKK